MSSAVGRGSGQVMPSDAGAAEGASGPVMIGNVMPRELGPSEKAPRPGVMGGLRLMGRGRVHLGVVGPGVRGLGGLGCGAGGSGLGACRIGEGERGGVWAGVGTGEGSRETQARDGLVGFCWWVSRVRLVVCGLGSGGVVGGVSGVMGVGGLDGTRDTECGGWSRARESVSSRTRTKLLIVVRTLFTSRLLAGKVDASFNVDLRDWRELEAMKNQKAKGESRAKPRRYSKMMVVERKEGCSPHIIYAGKPHMKTGCKQVPTMHAAMIQGGSKLLLRIGSMTVGVQTQHYLLELVSLPTRRRDVAFLMTLQAVSFAQSIMIGMTLSMLHATYSQIFDSLIPLFRVCANL